MKCNTYIFIKNAKITNWKERLKTEQNGENPFRR